MPSENGHHNHRSYNTINTTQKTSKHSKSKLVSSGANVTNNFQGEPVEIRRSTGIPRSFMVPVEGPKAPGAMMTPTGSFAVPVVDR